MELRHPIGTTVVVCNAKYPVYHGKWGTVIRHVKDSALPDHIVRIGDNRYYFDYESLCAVEYELDQIESQLDRMLGSRLLGSRYGT